jgi:drug/metabolite transporter (DMT)-like permease
MHTTSSSSLANPSQWKGVGFALLSGIGVVIMPTTARLAYDSGSDTMTVAFSRGVVATIILLLILLALRQKISLPREYWMSSLLAGIGGILFVYGFYGALLSVNISLAVLIIYLYPITVAVYEHMTGVIKLSLRQWLLTASTFGGLVLVIGTRLEQMDFVGITLAFVAMFASVLITIANHRVTEAIGSLRSNLYLSLWSAIAFSIVLFLFGEFKEPQSTLGWGSLFVNGGGYCIAWVAFFAAARILGATRASMITLVDPPMAVLVAWLVFGEILTAFQWGGFVIVLMALILFEREARRSIVVQVP